MWKQGELMARRRWRTQAGRAEVGRTAPAYVMHRKRSAEALKVTSDQFYLKKNKKMSIHFLNATSTFSFL